MKHMTMAIPKPIRIYTSGKNFALRAAPAAPVQER